MSGNATIVPVIHLEFHYKQFDTFLAVGYAIATLLAFWVLCCHMSGSARDPGTTGFFTLMSLAALVRSVWYATPYSVHVSGYVPQRVYIFDDGWYMLFISEIAEMAGTYILYAVFILMVVFWADILHGAFDRQDAPTYPMRVFATLCFLLGIAVSTGFALFGCNRIDSLWLLMYNDIVVVVLSLVTFVFVAIFACRMRTVLIAILEVSQVETTARIQTVTRTGFICCLFLLLNACFALVMTYHMYELQFDASIPTGSTQWFLFIMAKHLMEIFVLYFLLWTLWSTSPPDEPHMSGKSQADRRQYEKIPELEDQAQKTLSTTTNGSGRHYHENC
ncbi:hypothetical protein SPRG_02250 [Saprolegnia parasitica CBS 223.65]|uniref:THH1/TOM1/TOM3 domain-containing protein n=1 Tax=Saprolegnia parasitica (strain CBS 223.65) TaxID=695850 RepID=A0A067CSE1_SAPPC|nr:hypothetical protein SPRG_02250 [Saprolegnia parasitica CBS 223.65]KDO33443.1 hypothetical protein SPRG_02250 [Saprolegnia parasitica CBS 223.65]|eukprot:XP_012196189.1 hypothetical protein SPRG_02250 [Saprolegnia parasitica CBS 223.65]